MFGPQTKEDPKLSWFLAAYTPWVGLAQSACDASREGLKASNAEGKVLKEAIDFRPAIVEILDRVNEDNVKRSDVGMVIRKCKDSWRAHILYSLLYDLACDLEKFTMTADRYQQLLIYIEEASLQNAHKMPPILNGNEIHAALGKPKDRRWLSKAVDMLAQWQFDAVEPTKDQAIEMLVSKKADFGVS